MKIRGIDIEERFIDEQIAPRDRKPWITWWQPTFIWTGEKFEYCGGRYGDVASRDISVDVRKMIEEQIPLIKRQHDPEIGFNKDGDKLV